MQVTDTMRGYWDEHEAGVVVRFLVNGVEHGAYFKFERPVFKLTSVSYFTDIDDRNTLDIQMPDGTDFETLTIAATSELETWTN
jgi:hypothetical protein